MAACSALVQNEGLEQYENQMESMISGRHFRHPGPFRLIPAALSIPWSNKTHRATQTLTRSSIFTRYSDLFTEQPPREFAARSKSDLCTSLRPACGLRAVH